MESKDSVLPLRPEARPKRLFFCGVAALCLAYLLIEIVYSIRLPLVMDEFNYASYVHNLKKQVPYRDFSPTKTVLGFYIQLPMLYLSRDPWTGLILIKCWMAVINALAFAVCAILLSTIYRRDAVLWGLALLVPMSTLLERSTAVRVDMMTGLCGFVSLVLLLRGRFFWSGVLCALSFFVSQKGVYYILSADCALAVWVLVRRRAALREAFVFNVAMLVTLLAYLGFWSLFAPFSRVWKDTFLQDLHYVMAFQITHKNMGLYWHQTLLRNPAFYGFALIGLGLLAVRCGGYLWAPAAGRSPSGPDRREWLLLVYGAVLTALCAWHKQPWPYFFVMLIPTLFVVHVSFFDRILPGPQDGRTGVYLYRAVVVAAILLGVVYPLTRFRHTLPRSNAFQRQTVRLGSQLVGSGETYVDGINMLYTIPQTVEATRWLGGLGKYRLMDMSSEKLQQVVEELERAPVKLVIYTYRLPRVPPEIATHFVNNFDHLWGDIFVYAPSIPPDRERFLVKFAGAYRVSAPDGYAVLLDGREATSGTVLALDKGAYANSNTESFRLHFLPAGFDKIAVPRQQGMRRLFYLPYTY